MAAHGEHAPFSLKVGDFLEIRGETFPFLVERIDERGPFVSELRPYWIYGGGYLKPETPIRVLTTKREVEAAQRLHRSREGRILPVFPPGKCHAS